MVIFNWQGKVLLGGGVFVWCVCIFVFYGEILFDNSPNP